MSSTEILVVTLFFALLARYLRFRFERRKMYRLAAEFDGPRPYPLIGNLPLFLMRPSEVFGKLQEGANAYESPCRLWFGTRLVVAVWDPENAQIVLNSSESLSREPLYSRLVEPVTREGLFTLEGYEWRRHRKILAPVFNQKYLESLFGIFREHSGKLVENLKTKADNTEFDITNDIGEYSLINVLDILLDLKESGTGQSDVDSIVQWINLQLRVLVSRMTNVFYASDLIFRLTPLSRRANEFKARFDSLIASILEKWEEKFEKKLAQDATHSDSGKPMKFVEYLCFKLEGGASFTREELSGEITNIIAAAFETTTTIVSFALIMLGMHPEIQEKTHRELQDVLGERREIEVGDLKKFRYLERVMKETMRVIPPLVGLLRRTTGEIQLKYHTIPADTTVVVGVLNLHRDPKSWRNPGKFDPDHFLREEEVNRHPYSYIPFSGGPRNCIGLRYAWISMKVVMANLVLNYEIGTPYRNLDDLGITVSMVPKPTKGFKVSLVPRLTN